MHLTVSIGSDHAARDLKKKIAAFLVELGCQVLDRGVEDSVAGSVDYPVYAEKVADDVTKARADRGILICGTGIGMSIAANKFAGIRAALISDEFSARATRAHNNSNILCLGARVINHDRALDFVKIWLETPFEGGRHQNRLDLISQFEQH